MNTREIVRVVVGSLSVYVVMAACSAGNSGPGRPIASAGNGATAGGSGNFDASAYGGTTIANAGTSNNIKDGSILDAIANPVPDAAAQSTSSGTRLKAMYQEATDGSKTYLYYQWYDSQRQEQCGFMAADDGTTRCLPTAELSLPGTYFSDSACTQQLAYRAKPTTGCTAKTSQPKYAGGYSTINCTLEYQIFSVGTPFSGATIYMKSGTTCTSLTASTYTTTMDFYSVGAEIPASSFVAATIKTDS